jgi:cation:H+ antiporter
MALLAVIGGLVILVCGGELLVSGAVKLARRLGMSSLLIGLTVVAFGTSMPELFVSLTAALEDHVEIMVGNVVGSNIANIGLVLGVSIMLRSLPVHFSKIARELYLLLFAGAAVAVISLFGCFNRFYGAVFFAVLIAYTCQAYINGRSHDTDFPIKENIVPHSYLAIFSLCGSGLFFLALGSKIFIAGAVAVARFAGISDLVIGLTMAAVGTSLPELASSLSALRRNQGDLLIGNILGSNLFNLLMVMGTTAMVTPFVMPRQTLIRDLPVMICFSALLIPVIVRHHSLKRIHGVMLVLAYGGYIYSLM